MARKMHAYWIRYSIGSRDNLRTRCDSIDEIVLLPASLEDGGFVAGSLENGGCAWLGTGCLMRL